MDARVVLGVVVLIVLWRTEPRFARVHAGRSSGFGSGFFGAAAG
eukprot:CAMPEP_0206516008 /NCGR_PEP_ID=MMETSP0324_2-20121206/63142_1 /ASSEMBLY_ACC=CAM_ASM_000836 /TAXON_ID=2866 /ORGANISM="Crypthecodinium cohnii, Strain Seligo" /LENGTH=43 /DNA_ID= /DNA_START= /DNA_END= /DNA_ORIENTATION=